MEWYHDQTEVDFTTTLPKEICLRILSFAYPINPKNIRDSLLHNPHARINKTCNTLVKLLYSERNIKQTITQFAKQADLPERAIALHLANLNKIKPESLDLYPANTQLNNDLIQAIKEDNFNNVIICLKNNADVNCHSTNNYTPLMVAAAQRKASNSHKIIQALLDFGAAINTQLKTNDQQYAGFTALMFATLFNASAAQALLDNGADTTTIKNDRGHTADDIIKAIMGYY